MPSKIKRSIHGILLLDKPTAITSNSALTHAKRIFSPKKVGHTGSLDPLATGMLPLCFGEATKFSGWLLEADKKYHCTAKLGVVTTTGDSDGEIIETNVPPNLTEREFKDLLLEFVAEQTQIPPIYSALKFKGKPLYEYARAGIKIDLSKKARKITIHELTLDSLTSDQFSFSVVCSKGTYIRSLVERIGKAIGCGAHITALHRQWVVPFQKREMIHFEQLEQAEDPTRFLLPIDAGLRDLPRVVLVEAQARAIFYGQTIQSDDFKPTACVCLYSEAGTFLGLARVDDEGVMIPRRLLSN